MCHFITAILPKEADTPSLDVIARKHHRQFEPLSNLSIEAQLRPGERYFLTTLGHCDCGTALGAGARDESQDSRDHHAGLKQLRAKGWSETKIARWLEQKQQVSARDDRVCSSRDIPRTEDWRQFIEEVLESGLTSYLGVLLHWYSGPLSARIQLAGRQVVVLRDMTEGTLAEVKEDVIYEFKRARP
jgi:hypothetical protein